RISSNDVNIIGAFIEALTRCQNRFLSASNLHHDRAFQHINKPICIVARGYAVRTAWRVLYCKHETFLARDVREVFRQDLGHLRLVAPRASPLRDMPAPKLVLWTSSINLPFDS